MLCGGWCVAEDGSVFTWGTAGIYGRLGHGDRMDRTTPRILRPLTTGERVCYVTCGSDHTLMLTSAQQARLYVGFSC